MLAVALDVLVGRGVDLYFMILPPLGSGPMPVFGVVEVSLAMGGVGVFFLVVPHALGKASLLLIKDSYLGRVFHMRKSTEAAQRAVMETRAAIFEGPSRTARLGMACPVRS